MAVLPDLPSKTIRTVTVVLFVIIGLLVYGTSLRNGFVRWDDGMLIYQNPAVMEVSIASIKTAFTTYDPELYIPLTLLSYQFDYLIGDGSPFPFHAHNLALHVINALLVTWLALLLFRNKTVALIAGLVFLIHPLHTEAVAWASGRKDVLSAMFFLMSVVSYMYFRSTTRALFHTWSVVLFGLGLLAKVMIVTLPVVLLLIDLREDGRLTLRHLKNKVPYFVLYIVFGIVALFGKSAVNEASTLLEKVLMACKSTMFYLKKIFMPTDLSVIYPFNGDISIASPEFYVPIAGLIAIALVIVASLKRTREIALWFAFFLITLAPTFINIVKGDYDVYIASDRYAYIPSIGILFIGAYTLARILERELPVARMKFQNRAVGIAAVMLLLVFSSMASAQSLVWRDSVALFEHALAHGPESSYAAHNNLGNAYRTVGQFDEAIAHYQSAIAIREHASIYANLGSAYRRAGKYSDAMEAYQQALQIDPNESLAHFGMGTLLATLGQTDDAIFAYERALELKPDSAEIYVNLGAAKDKQNKTDEAIAALEKAIELEPRLADAYYNLAVVRTKAMQYDEAIAAYEEAIALDPTTIPARINLALLYAQKGEVEAAGNQFRAILKVDPGNQAALSALSQLGMEP